MNDGEFHLQLISTITPKKVTLDLDCNKGNLNGHILVNVLKNRQDVLIPQFTKDINVFFQTKSFMDELKIEELTPIYQKKKSALRKRAIVL